MGYKNVCLKCKRVESLGTDYTQFRTGPCPECSADMFFVSHKFRPPKKTDKNGWELACFLITRGFIFQTIYADDFTAVSYPRTLRDAKEFVEKYRDKAHQQ